MDLIKASKHQLNRTRVIHLSHKILQQLQIIPSRNRAEAKRMKKRKRMISLLSMSKLPNRKQQQTKPKALKTTHGIY